VEQGYLGPSTLEGLQGSSEAGKIYLGDDDIYSIGLTATQPLFTGGALLSAHGAAKHAALAEELAAERTEERVRYEAAAAYLGLVRAEAALQAMEDAVLEMESHLADLEAMYDAGVLLEAEVMRARVQMSEMELARNTTRHGVDLAEASLGFVLGLGPEAEIVAVDDGRGRAFPERDLESWTRMAVERRSDLAAAAEMVWAADNGVSLARSGYFPSVVAIGSYMWDRPDREYQPEFYEHWSVTVAVEMNVFDWGLTGGRVREARAGLAQAERGREMMRDAVRLDVRRAFLEREEAMEGFAIAGRAFDQAEESLRVTRENFKNGQLTNSDVLSAQAALTRARMNKVDAQARLRLAEAGLELATSLTVAEGETR
jgi:outer membrane protein TolC